MGKAVEIHGTKMFGGGVVDGLKKTRRVQVKGEPVVVPADVSAGAYPQRQHIVPVDDEVREQFVHFLDAEDQ